MKTLSKTQDSHPASSVVSKYRAKFSSIAPQSARNSFEALSHCFLGISLENKNFTPEKLKALRNWITRRFDYCVILVGDSIHRITLETTQSRTPERSLTEALELGQSFIQENRYIFENQTSQTDFVFETCSQIQCSDDYTYFYQRLKGFFEENTRFRESVEAFGRTYYLRRFSQQKGDEVEKYIRHSCEYFLEEFAVFSCLQKRGISVMVYPGSFSTLTEIVSGEYPELFEEIKSLIVVSTHFKTRQAYKQAP